MKPRLEESRMSAFRGYLAWGLLVFLSCGGGSGADIAALDQPFLLAEGQGRRILDTELYIRAVSVIDGLDGSHRQGEGSVGLLVDHGIEEDIEVYLETGGVKTLGRYEVHFLEVISVEGDPSARLLVR